MNEAETEQFNNEHDKVYEAALCLKQWNRIYTAHTAADRDFMLRRNVAMQARWRSLFRKYDRN